MSVAVYRARTDAPASSKRLQGADFFREEYQLIRRIHRYPKPTIALVDGITMGGGMGISVNGRFRVASERTIFAMPEVHIGLFPDVGATRFLNRCPGRIGLYLALTGARVESGRCALLRPCDALRSACAARRVDPGARAGRRRARDRGGTRALRRRARTGDPAAASGRDRPLLFRRQRRRHHGAARGRGRCLGQRSAGADAPRLAAQHGNHLPAARRWAPTSRSRPPSRSNTA